MQQVEELKQLGNEAFRKNNYLAAFDWYNKAIQIDPQSFVLYSNRCAALLALGRYEEALCDADFSIRLNSDWVKGWYRKGVALGKLGKKEESYDSHIQCLTLDPEWDQNKASLVELLWASFSESAHAEQDNKSKEKEENIQDRALTFKELECPLCKEVFYKPVSMPCGHTFCSPCILHWHASVRQAHPSRWAANCPCPSCTAVSGIDFNPCVILSSFIESHLSKEHQAAALRMKGLDAVWSGDNSSAIDFFTQALSAIPSSPTIINLRAEVFIATDQASKALDDANACIKFDPGNAKGYLLRGKALYIIGEHDEALKAFISSFLLSGDENAQRACVNIIVDTLAQLCKKSRQCSTEETMERQNISSTPSLRELLQLLSRENEQVSAKNSRPRALVTVIDDSELIAEEFQCLLCLSVLFQPVTAVCGHTFCRVCLARALDHNNVCPHCRASLSEHISMQRQETNTVITALLQNCCPEEWGERNALHKAELEEQKEFFPIFVCNIMYPGIPCHLHIFEPRYRLMIRSVMESGYQRFGMCVHTPPTIQGGRRVEGYASIGTVAEVKSVQMLPDGRSLIETVGGRRFQVKERSVRNGYNVAKVEWFDDFTPEEEISFLIQQRQEDRTQNSSLPELTEEDVKKQLAETLPMLVTAVKRFCTESILPALGQTRRNRLEEQLGPMPEDDNYLSYWMANILPLTYEEQYQFLQMRSPMQRYAKLFSVIQRLTEN